jgi:hypothetical protein
MTGQKPTELTTERLTLAYIVPPVSEHITKVGKMPDRPPLDIPDEPTPEFAAWAENITHDLEAEFTQQQVVAVALMAIAELDQRLGADGAGLALVTRLITAVVDEERHKRQGLN